MKFKAEKVQEHIGDIVKVEGSQHFEGGVYQIVETNADTGLVVLFDIYKSVVYTSKLDPTEILTIIHTGTKEKVELMHEALVKIAMQLMDDGNVYADDPIPDRADKATLDHILVRIKTLRVLMDIENGTSGEAGENSKDYM